VTDFADDPGSEVERQAKALEVVALTEAVTYLLLAYFWLVSPNVAGKAIMGSIHGLVWLAFVGMTVIIRPALRLSWPYVALVVLTGPIGGVLVFERLRREGVPEREASATG
jgi:hypothetical protein